MRANWIPRLQNEEADALTNSDFRHFAAKHRIEVDLDKLPFIVLRELFDAGEAYVAEFQALKDEDKRKKLERSRSPRRKRNKADALKNKDPW